jgi:integrase
MPTYLQKRRRRWYAILEIPAALRPRFGGKPRFVKSLETDSPTLAQRRVGPIVARWLSDLDRAREIKGEPITGDAAFFRRLLREATTDGQRSEILEQIEAVADDIGTLNVEHVGQAPSTDPVARQFYAEATGAHVSTLEHLKEWLSTSGSTAKTKDMHQSDVNRFAVKFPLLRDVDRPGVRRWVTGLMNDEGLAPKTVQRVLSALRGYWRYLQSIAVVGEGEEPFSKLEVARQAKRTAPKSARQPFEPADVPKLVQAAAGRDDRQLADLIRLAMWSGCRIEELCALKLEDVAGDRLTVREAKSSAGVRVVPIHAELQPVVTRLVKDSKDGYVLSGLSFNKYGDRSNAIGKRFGHLRTALGFGAPFVFHSIRKTVVTILENAGVSENVVADIVGHEKPRITYGLYSGGATLEVKRLALAKLTYP